MTDAAADLIDDFGGLEREGDNADDRGNTTDCFHDPNRNGC